jgi:twitching motility protein PilT
MIVTPLIRDLILDEARTGGIREAIAEGRDRYGMQTFDQHLMDLVNSGAVAYDVALAASTRPADFDLQMRTLQTSSGGGESAMMAAVGGGRDDESRGNGTSAAQHPETDIVMGANLFDS